MKYYLTAVLLLLCLSLAFSASNLEINSVDYNSLYSSSNSLITFTIENTGDEDAILVLSELNGFNYNLHSAPNIIAPDETDTVIFSAAIPCMVKESTIPFFANFTYTDSEGDKKLNSTIYEGIVKSPVDVTLLSPNSLSSSSALQSAEPFKLSYKLLNPSIQPLSIIINVSSPNSIYSKILSFTGEYSPRTIKDAVFVLQPGESYIFSHTIRSTVSGEAGSYVVTISNAGCVYNKEYLILNYQTITSIPGPGFNIAIADEGNLLFLLVSVLFIVYSYLKVLSR